ncbi:AAA family ATPase [Actinokineospora bangkokensis]|uniref:Nuclease SbcCD subunit C n=1 Tax=Actinokineospora bangkokensis TaxID=1193682 RepID=A0A1Q9LDI4_9PSEU|nr:SMC family ATPase [Actinokineospora bangkokensis]OLR90069.1 exonuclease SbcC [Actinokineospora bangkokensis]
MRLHRLEVSAFGPYPGTEVVDFDALAADGLFLLHGDTGAGKTTLLDAVAFALFGTVPGMRGETKRLRCDYADPDQVTEVALDLTVQGHRLRVVRSPEYERPKKRGEGTTRQQARVSLSWVGQAPSGHAPDGITRIDEVADTVERLLGMTKDQFFQVVLLPQGDFARFLRSGTEERETLLEKLFGTQNFARVEQWFRTRRTEKHRELEAARREAGELLARFEQASGQDAPQTPDLGWLDAVTTAAEALHRVTEQGVRATAAQRARAEEALAEGRDLVAKVERVRRATRELAELEAQAPARASWRTELDDARRAAPVVLADDQLRRARRAVDAAVARAEQAVDAAGETGVKRLREWVARGRRRGVDGSVVDELRARAGALREEAGALGGLVAEAERQAADEQRLARLVTRSEQLAQTSADVERALAEYPPRIAAAREAANSAAGSRSAVDGLRARRDEVAAAAKDTAAAQRARQALVSAEDDNRAAVDAHQEARERVQALRQARLDGMAAELAAGLAAGEACPVCGAHEHPAPALPSGHTATPEDEQRAEVAEQRALHARERAGQALTRARTELAQLEERLAPWRGVDLSTELATVRAAFDGAVAAAARVDVLDKELAELEQGLDALRQRRSLVERDSAAVDSERRGLVEAVQERAAVLAQARGPFESVAARVADVQGRTARLDQVADACAALVAARERLAEHEEALSEAVAAAGFPSAAKALGAAREDNVVEKLRGKLADAEAAVKQHKETLSDMDLFGIEPDVEVDLLPLRDAVERTRSAAEQAVAAAGEARTRFVAVRDLGKRLRAAWQRLEPVEAAYAELDALTDVVNGRGQNSARMSLRSYVLAARLEEVAVSASARLRDMSQGRYSFVHSDAAGARGTRGGLGLDVLDDYSGRVRPAKTLSGGESFLASLSLALGLADVVAAESGGALLDTLFVDEGFGTLDANALDDVMSILDTLRDGGRVVGLVSHVEELRQRIPVRLHVKKARGGSRVVQG